MIRTSVTGGKKVVCGMAKEDPRDLDRIRELAEAGAIRTVVDRSFPLEEAAEAHRYVEQGLRKGHVVLTVAHRGEEKSLMEVVR